ncbi:MAG: AmmeMemoRadiSam system protein B [Candidatus Aenigmatarchaeota archaeon]
MEWIREPAVARMFYEGGREPLQKRLNSLFKNMKPGRERAVVSPHAGYIYSGRTAAHAIASLAKAERFIILGPNHTGLGPEFSIMDCGTWRTPLGKVQVDRKIADELLKNCGALEVDETAHIREHSIEVQLPFLQHRFPKFSFVPVCIKNTGYSEEFMEKCVALGHEVARAMKKDHAGLVASSDFSHYLPKKVADEKDTAALRKILAIDVKGFFSELSNMDASVCGFGPIAVAMAAAKELTLRPRLIHKSTSGDETGDYGSVVAYYAIGFG